MGFSVLPTNIGGFNLGGTTGPLASLLAPTSQIDNLVYPSDLGSNPSMGHAVIISAFDYTTGIGNALNGLPNSFAGTFQGVLTGTQTLGGAITNFLGATGINGFNAESLNNAAGVLQAGSYKPLTPSPPLATVSLFMPENLNVSYNSVYNEVSITQELGLGSYVGGAIADYNKRGMKDTVTTYSKALAAKGLNVAANKVGGTGGNIGALALQGAGIFTNPQIQLLYQGTTPRQFTLDFLLTPRSSAEAKTIQNICDTFAFYSLPGVAGGQIGEAGQFLTPPQIFKIQFKFLGQNSISGTLSNVLTSALNSSGLGFLTQSSNPAGAINAGAAAKVMTVNDCFLSDVNVDYAPNGWAAYNDGYPVQTKLTLTFKETTMITKEQFKGSQIAANYSQSPGQIAARNSALDSIAAGYNGPNGESAGS